MTKSYLALYVNLITYILNFPNPKVNFKWMGNVSDNRLQNLLYLKNYFE